MTVSLGALPEPRAGLSQWNGVSGTAGHVCVWTSGDQLSDGGFSFLVGAASQPPAASSAVRTKGESYMREKEKENTDTPFCNHENTPVTPPTQPGRGSQAARGSRGM